MSDYRKLSDYAFEDRIVIPFHVFPGPLLLPVYLAFSKWYVLFSYSQTTLVKFNIGLNAKQLLLKSICAIFVKHWTVHNQSKLNCKIQFLCSNQNSTRKIGAFNYFAKFAGKNLSRSPFLIESQAFNLFIQHGCFPVNFTKFLRTPVLWNTSGQLVLNMLPHFGYLAQEKCQLRQFVFSVLQTANNFTEGLIILLWEI